MRLFRTKFLISWLLALCGLAAPMWAQPTAARIASPADDSKLTVLRGNTPAWVQSGGDRGPASPSTRLSHVRLILSRTSQQRAALDAFEAQLQDKSSPSYHKWLTPEQFGKLYGPADADLNTLVVWLQAHGLSVEPLAPGHIDIAFSGTVAQLENTFHTRIHAFQVDGAEFYSNITDPQIPAAFAPVVQGVARLNTFKPRSNLLRGANGKFDPATGKKIALPAGTLGKPQPNFTYNNKGEQLLFTVPADAATIYDSPNPSLNANYSAAKSYTGKGVTIGIGGDSSITTKYVVGYRTMFLGNTIAPTITNVDGVSENSDAGEAYLDAEVSGGLAPDATIHMYVSSDLFSGVQQAINDNAIDIFSLSFGDCEVDLSSSDNAFLSSLWEQANTQGIAVTVSTGDSGSAVCDNPNFVASASTGLAVSGFASTPYNIAVGGTDFYPLLTDFSKYVTEEPTAGSVAGKPSQFFRSALSYIPESTWNQSTVSDTTLSANTPAYDSNGNTSIWSGSGGASSCATNTSVDNSDGTVTPGTCTAGYSKPYWQRGAGVPADGVRDLPDVSLLASGGVDGALWLTCGPTTDQNGNPVDECIPASDGTFYFGGAGGTSASTPAFAGILAMVQEKTGGRLGQAAKDIYDLYNGTHAAAIFHDVTVGNNSVYCASGTPNCANNAGGYPFETGYDTTAGYDLATGIGSVDITQMLNYWSSSTGSAKATITVKPDATSIPVDQTLQVAVAITGGASTPTGTVTLTGGGYNSFSESLVNGSYTFTIPSGSLNAGSDTLLVLYSGDENYASSSQSAPVTVTLLTPVITLTPAASTVSTLASLSVTATLSGPGAVPTGSVVLSSGGYTSASVTPSNGSYTFTIPAGDLAAGTDTLTLTYSGDWEYSPLTGTAKVTVVAPTPTFTLSASALTLSAGATTNNASVVTVQPANGYTGTVVLTAAVTSSPAGAISAPTFTGSSVAIATSSTSATGTITVATTGTSGANVQLASGAGWFGAAGGSALAALLLFLPAGTRRRWTKTLSVVLLIAAASFVAIGCGGGSKHSIATPTVSVQPSSATIGVGTALPVAITVAGTGTAPTGTVSLSGGGLASPLTASLTAGGATITIPANSLTIGSDTLTDAYAGDSNYSAASGTATVTVSKAATTAGNYTVTVTGTDAANNITATTTFQLTVN